MEQIPHRPGRLEAAIDVIAPLPGVPEGEGEIRDLDEPPVLRRDG
jgi:hypothetical protein